MNVDLEALLSRVEQAVDAHPRLERHCIVVVNDKKIYPEPELILTRSGCSVTIRVKVKGSHRKACDIWGEGDTPESAVESVVGALDRWAEAIAS